MADINLSKAVRSNLLSLQNTAALMGKTQERLSTGNKVNSALDNPTNFFTAASLKSRSSDLNLLMDSVGNAVQTIAAADKGISAITKLVESAQSTARQALQSSATVIDPSSTAQSAVPAVATASGTDFAAGTAATFKVNGVAVALTTTETTEALALDKINDDLAAGGLTDITATVVGNKLTLTSTGTGNINITDVTGTATGLSTADSAQYAPATEAGQGTKANPKRAELLDQYNDLLTQIDQLAKDSGFNGVNLISGDNLQVTFNEDGQSKLDIQGKNLNAAGLGLQQETTTTLWDSNTGINGTLDKLKAATESLRTQSSIFGSNLSVVQTRQDFTKNMISVLETGAANLTLADTNEEAANLLALQTRQSLSTTALSMASQADQNVLQLLR